MYDVTVRPPQLLLHTVVYCREGKPGWRLVTRAFRCTFQVQTLLCQTDGSLLVTAESYLMRSLKKFPKFLRAELVVCLFVFRLVFLQSLDAVLISELTHYYSEHYSES